MKHRRVLSVCAIVSAVLVGGWGALTTWVPAKVDDPFADAQCNVHEPASWGSYIYQWPEKFDGIYWPFSDQHWIWTCEVSGYVSFGSDFNELSEADKAKIEAHLAAAGALDIESVPARLKRMEDIYALRDMDAGFNAILPRVMAHFYERQFEEPDVALSYRAAALPLLEAELEIAEAGFPTAQLLYLLGDYNRQVGDVDLARSYFARARSHEWVDEDGEPQVGVPYLNEIIAEREALFPDNAEQEAAE